MLFVFLIILNAFFDFKPNELYFGAFLIDCVLIISIHCVFYEFAKNFFDAKVRRYEIETDLIKNKETKEKK